MKLLVLGGTGGMGRQVVQQALAAGHDVTVLARDPAKVTTQQPRLHVIAGDLTDPPRLTEALRGHDAVISALGRGLSFKSEHLIERSVPTILTSMKNAGVKRLIFMSAWGVGETGRDAPLLPKIFFSTLLRGIYLDKLAGDTLIRQSDVDWTIVLPTKLHDGPLTKQYRSGEHLPMSGMPSISRADTAHFIVDRLSDATTIRKAVIVSQ